jgi:hypothetical protein
MDSLMIKTNIKWDDTPNFKKGFYSIKHDLEQIAGETVYGKGRSFSKEAFTFVTSYLEKSTQMDIFKCIEGGTIIKNPPTSDECITKLKNLGIRSLKYLSNLSYDQKKVTDDWAEDALVHEGAPLNISVSIQARVLLRKGKRFSAKKITPLEFVTDLINNSRGMLSEGYVISFLNVNLKCPECKTIGNIGWCDGVSHKSVDSFRDAVCMNCHKNKVITLFEIKTRWEKVVTGNCKGTYAGSFIALNTLMTINANIYLVIASRDTGDVRIGKITSAKMIGNHNWLYALQENLEWGSPSSFVTCSKGFLKCPVKMPVLVKTITDSFFNDVSSKALKEIDKYVN